MNIYTFKTFLNIQTDLIINIAASQAPEIVAMTTNEQMYITYWTRHYYTNYRLF